MTACTSSWQNPCETRSPVSGKGRLPTAIAGPFERRCFTVVPLPEKQAGLSADAVQESYPERNRILGTT
jgi:hypothetical protein